MTTHAIPVAAVRVAGKVRNGKLTVKTPMQLPDGDVEVTVVGKAGKRDFFDGLTLENLIAQPVFGMWKDRAEMKDSAAYIHALRRKIDKEMRDGG